MKHRFYHTKFQAPHWINYIFIFVSLRGLIIFHYYDSDRP